MLAVEFIKRSLREPLSVERIALESGLSPSRLQQRFHKRYGESIQVVVERHRMEEARYWLAHSGLSIAQVAERAGFEDALYFSRRFRKFFDLGPSDFRKNQNTKRVMIERSN